MALSSVKIITFNKIFYPITHDFPLQFIKMNAGSFEKVIVFFIFKSFKTIKEK